MFRKIVSQLSLSPATVERVADYARTVRQRQKLHGWAIVALSAVGIAYIITLLTPVSTSLSAREPADQPPVNSALTYAHASDSTEASAGQLITWRLTVQNTSDTTVTDDIWFLVDDITDYADITTISNEGILSESDDRILWPGVTVTSGGSHTFTVTATIHTPVSEAATQRGNSAVYDCKITTIFGNTQDVTIICSPLKQIESLFRQLPQISLLTGGIIYAILFILNIAAYLSLRLRSKELRIIRAQINIGGL